MLNQRVLDKEKRFLKFLTNTDKENKFSVLNLFYTLCLKIRRLLIILRRQLITSDNNGYVNYNF